MNIHSGIRFIIPFLKNKYALSLILFFVWILFFDSNNLIDRAVNLKHVHQLERDKIYYENKIINDQTKLTELESSPANLEKFAREQYLMKKENEDIFIVVE